MLRTLFKATQHSNFSAKWLLLHFNWYFWSFNEISQDYFYLSSLPLFYRDSFLIIVNFPVEK